MKKIGLIGGMGPESTLDYYRKIIHAFNGECNGLSYPEIIIYSTDINELMAFVSAERWDDLSDWLLDKIVALHHAGAEFAAIASNTPHYVFDDINSKSPIPLLSIVETTCSRAQQMGLQTMGLMGTMLTMEAEFYKSRFVDKGMHVIVPLKEERELIHRKLFAEIELGIIKDSTRQELLSIVDRMVADHDIDALILGCTELPLILPENGCGIHFLNTTAIHCERIVEFCLGK